MADDSRFTAAWSTGGARAALIGENGAFGESVTYSTDSGTTWSDAIYGGVEVEAEGLEEGELGKQKITRCRVTVSTGDWANPQPEDRVTVRSVVYVVIDVNDQDGGMAELECVRSEQYEASRENWRVNAR